MAATMSHADGLMGLALHEARRALGRTRPNPAVGCVVARDGVVVAVGHHVCAGAPHAEAVALQQASAAARGADVYVTLEPCDHHGRTPPCTQALIEAGVGRVFIGMRDPNPIVDGRGIERLQQAGIDVVVGVLEAECQQLNEAFTHFVRHRRPFVVSKLAQSLDGRVATHRKESQWITGQAARDEGHRLRDTLDGIVVGVGTVLADNPQLTCRLPGGRDPVRIILDTHARTPPEAQAVQLARTSSAPTWIMVGSDAAAERCEALQRAGAEVVVCPVMDGRLDLHRLLETLAARDLMSLLVEGGPTASGGFFDARLVDKVYAFVAPLILGGVAALGSVGATGAARIGDGARLTRCETRQLGDDWLVVGYPCWQDRVA